ncbi:hypothetical protein L228DRAFT_273935 [Xylona heveae TC161]|uniref:Uncharacterized protein n=1 Tax=Xylona heveae (strain CBS 132557 / TC161) TaxID=1328760 RepID=A0A164ZUA4_XYLHT|nr:hypothetical protein L228DRAFT_273935 [Xylona heveae TC161]KZF19529.1 hypothetical protein L228DRAFT_273935 [Xylona heveae TC161]
MPGTRPRRRSSSSHAYSRQPAPELSRPQITTRSYTSDVRIPKMDYSRHPRGRDHSQDTMSSYRITRNVTKRRRWPPSPSVEDETEALSKELGSSDSLSSSDPNGGEVPSRGTVDQQPILLEVLPRADPPHNSKTSERQKDVQSSFDARKDGLSKHQGPPATQAGSRLDDTNDDDVIHVPRRQPSPYAYSKTAIPSQGNTHKSSKIVGLETEVQPPNVKHSSPASSREKSNENYQAGSSAWQPSIDSQQYSSSAWRENDVTAAPHGRVSSLQGDGSYQREKQWEKYLNSLPPSEHLSTSRQRSANGDRPGWHGSMSGGSSSPISHETYYDSHERKSRPSSWSGRSSAQSWGASENKAEVRSPSVLPSPPHSPGYISHGSEKDHYLRVNKHRSHSPAISPRPPSPLSPYKNLNSHSKESFYDEYPTPVDPDEPSLYGFGKNSPRHSTFPIERPRIEISSPSSHRRTPSAPIYLREQAPFLQPPPRLGPRSASYSDRAPSPKTFPLHAQAPFHHHHNPPPGFSHSPAYHDPISSHMAQPTPSFKAQLEALRICRRSRPSSRYNDWYTLRDYPKYDICPSCLDTVFGPAGFKDFFKPSAPKPPGTRSKCMFSFRWVRMAWILTLRRRLGNLGLIFAVLHVMSTEEPCPGEMGTCSHWRAPVDSGGDIVEDFLVCPRCIALVGAIFPCFRGSSTFQRIQLPNLHGAESCGLRASSTRFAAYIETLEYISEQSRISRTPPDTDRLVSFIDARLDLPECRKDDRLQGNLWHFISDVPHFTVCEECYFDVVLPEAKRGSWVARQLHPHPRRLLPQHEPVSCQLYSERMRTIFRLAASRDDLEYLVDQARRRKQVEEALQEEFSQLIRTKPGLTEHRVVFGQEHNALMDDHMTAAQLDRIVETWKQWE